MLDATLAPLTGDLAGWVEVHGALLANLDPLTASFSGFAQVKGSLSTTLAPLDAALIGEVAYAGPLSATLAPLAGSLAATFTLAVIATRGERTVYRLTLTGANDLVLPMSSFQARRRDNQPTYLACVVPNGPVQAQAITDNSTGELVIDMTVIAGDSETTSELVRAALEDIRLDEGAHSASATLTGYKTVATAMPKIVTVHSVSYRTSRNGKRRLRCEVNFDLNPGDTVQDGEARWVAREIAYAIGPALSLMEVAE